MYTREQVLGMVAGRELDHLVEVYIMQTRIPPKGFHINPKHYSTDIAAAWEVVEALQPQGIYIDIRTCADFYEVQALEYTIDRRTETVGHPSVAVGICKAALLSLLKED